MQPEKEPKLKDAVIFKTRIVAFDETPQQTSDTRALELQQASAKALKAFNYAMAIFAVRSNGMVHTIGEIDGSVKFAFNRIITVDLLGKYVDALASNTPSLKDSAQITMHDLSGSLVIRNESQTVYDAYQTSLNNIHKYSGEDPLPLPLDGLLSLKRRNTIP